MKYGHTKDMVHWFEKEKTIYEFRESHIIIYSTEDGLANIETAIEGDTVWLSTDQMAELFQKNKSTISRHIKNIFDEGELIRDSIVAKYATTAADGKTYIGRNNLWEIWCQQLTFQR